MTSSLVGSEMCIRDSWTGAASSGYTPPLPGDDGYGPAAPADPTTHNIWAVSYTHLTLPTICSV
eukprot:10407702-Prorocentrum_lima.AAC.1